ncbi:MAG: tetratricopeptide repeat protein [Candidatus Omnitrophota bacterium]
MSSHSRIIALILVTAILIPCNSHSSFAADQRQTGEKKIDRAMWLFQHEEYEEALILLKEVRREEPESSNAAFYLGLTYKRLQNYLEAIPHLEAAATLRPIVKNAIPELIDVLYQSGKIEEAKKWIERAETESINPAQITFYKGLVLLKEEDTEGAIMAFEEAERLDESMASTVKYYKGIAYMQAQEFKDAREIFRDIVVQQPTTDMAEFANEYMDVLAMREKQTRPYGGYIRVAMEYDDNVMSKPLDDALSVGIGDEGDWRQVYNMQGELRFKPTENMRLRGVYSFYGTKQFDLGFYDTMSHDFALQPSLQYENVTIGFPVHYNYVTINDKKYSETVGISNLNNIMAGKKNMFQLMLQLNFKDHDWAPTRDNEDRDAREYLGSAGWFYFLSKKRDGFINLRYALNYENAKGNNWDYIGNRLTASAIVPLVEKIRWSIAGDFLRQDFLEKNTTYDKQRYDNVFTVSNFLSYEIYKDVEIKLQHTYVNNDSTIGIFKNDRNIYSLGIRYEF